jgi:Flp pilus assembly pilin Flp
MLSHHGQHSSSNRSDQGMGLITRTVEMIRRCGAELRFAEEVAALRLAASSRSGVAAAEYAILAVAIVIVVGIAVVQLSDPTTGAFSRVGGTVLSEQSGLEARIAGAR